MNMNLLEREKVECCPPNQAAQKKYMLTCVSETRLRQKLAVNGFVRECNCSIHRYVEGRCLAKGPMHRKNVRKTGSYAAQCIWQVMFWIPY